MTPIDAPFLSVVVPMYNESAGLDVLFARLTKILNDVTPDWEILCVNDGSTDDTLPRLKDWHKKEERIRYVSLSRNFGKEAALTAGLHHAFGQCVIPIDADLQDPPELIPEMVALWKKGFKVVLATRRSRISDTTLKRISARLFYKLMGRVTSVHIPQDTGDFRLMDQKVVQVIRLLPERTRFMKGLFAWVGFSTTTVYFDRAPRAMGTAKQSVRSLWRLAKDGVFSFTTLPLQLTTYMGILISAAAFCYAGFLLVYKFLFGIDVPGYASIMLTVLIIGGVQLICLGVVGEYIGRIYRESKQRPIYVIEETSATIAHATAEVPKFLSQK